MEYETENTMFLFGVSKTGNHVKRKIKRPEYILIIIDNIRGLFQLIVNSDEDLSEFNTDDILAVTLTISNDPQQDYYGQCTNLGYYSIKIHAAMGKFVENRFNYITRIFNMEDGNKSVMLRYNLPIRRTTKYLGEKRNFFLNHGGFVAHRISFYEDPDFIIIKSLNDKKVIECIHDMSNMNHGCKVIDEYDVEDPNKVIEEILK